MKALQMQQTTFSVLAKLRNNNNTTPTKLKPCNLDDGQNFSPNSAQMSNADTQLQYNDTHL